MFSAYTGFKKRKSFLLNVFVGEKEMLNLDRESLLDIIRDEYQEEITKIITNCQFSGKNYLDVDGLNSALRTLKIDNFAISLDEDDWFELLYELAPDVYDRLSYGQLAA